MQRRRGQVILLKLDTDFDPEAEALLRDQLGLREALIIKSERVLGVCGLSATPRGDVARPLATIGSCK